MYGWAVAGITAAVLSALLWNAERRLDNAQQDVARLELGLSTAVTANKTVRATLQACQGVNAENAAQRDQALQAAQLAAERAAQLALELEDIANETFTPTDTECRTLVDPLPDDFVDFLCIKSAGNCSEN